MTAAKRQPAADGTGAQIDIVQDDPVSPRWQADEKSTRISFVRFGLWDSAFRMIEPTAGANEILFNEASERDNFIGADSRRFYIRILHPAMAGAGRIQADWVTTYANGRIQDSNAKLDQPSRSEPRITLLERTRGVFASNALMLTVGDVDAGAVREVVPSQDRTRRLELRTHSGFTDGSVETGLRARGESNFRIRQGSMFGSIRVTYPSGGTTRVEKFTPIFRREPDERRRLQVEVVVVRDASNNAPVIADVRSVGSRFWKGHVQRMREVYERVGIYVQTSVVRSIPAGSDIVQIVQASGNDRATIVSVQAPSVRPANHYEATPFASSVRSFIYPPSAGPPPDDSMLMIYMPYQPTSVDSAVNVHHDYIIVNSNTLAIEQQDSIPAHEVGHSLLRGENHWENPVPWGRKYQGPYGKLRYGFDSNLMNAFWTEERSAKTVLAPVRLFDFADTNGVNQIQELAAEKRLLRPL